MNNLEILYEDNHVIVVVKPPNIPSQADSSKDIDMLSIVKKYIKERYNKPGNVYAGLVQRLDRPVSGIMIFAKTSKAASRLTDEIKQHKVKKTYLAVVRGLFKEKEGTLVNYIVKQSDNSSKITTEEIGKLARLKYTVIDENREENLSLVRINLETGRHHQIRVQFANINHPLYGDQRYGLKDKKQIALLSYKVEFVHPTKKEVMEFSIDIPKTYPWELFNCVK